MTTTIVRSVRQILALCAVSIIFAAATVQGALAASLKFDKTSFSVKTGDTFNVQIVIDPGTEQVTSTDAYVVYDGNFLQAQTIVGGTYFPQVLHDKKTNLVYVGAMIQSPTDFKTGKGTVATITFKATGSGSTKLTYQCDKTLIATSKIIKNDPNATDIIECSQNEEATIAVSGPTATPAPSGQATPTPTTVVQLPVTSGGSISTPTATIHVTSLPQSGTTENMISMAAAGTILLVFGGIAKLLLKL